MNLDKIYRVPRLWSNKELLNFSHIFKGAIINVSGWNDNDKNGKRYNDYFNKSSKYYISNVGKYRGECGFENEMFLDLEKKLPEKLIEQFDVVFNHTVLEHIFNIQQAFDNLCNLSKDIIITVVPFVQEQHSTDDFGDYWRFTPQAIVENFKIRGFETVYISTTPFKNTSKYIFAISSKKPEQWDSIKNFNNDYKKIGITNIKNNLVYKILTKYKLNYNIITNFKKSTSLSFHPLRYIKYHFKIGLLQKIIMCINKGFPIRVALLCDVAVECCPIGTLFSHPIGIVIRKGTKIGLNCAINQNVTIGSKNMDYFSKNRFIDKPAIIGDNVVIGSHAIILGNVSIGNNSIIGAGAIVLTDVPQNTVVVGTYKDIKLCVESDKSKLEYCTIKEV